MIVDVALAPSETETPAEVRDRPGVQQTTCCIVGGGPAGAVLALLLARQGVPVMLLEAHNNFDRDFRGNTLNPSVMEIMDELGLADRLLQLRHAKIPRFTVQTAAGRDTFADFSRLKTRYPYVTMLPQVSFLEFITREAQRYPHFHLVMGANVQALIEEDGGICGVRYRGPDGWHEVRALLTVGADGRFSRIRRLADIESITTASPLDVLWFYLPRQPDDRADASAHFRVGRGGLLVLMEHVDAWQVGYIIAKGSYPRLRAAGFPALRRSIAALAPEFANRLEHLRGWKQLRLLSVESSRLREWYRRGLLVIGDAAHVMSPVGGVGINYAIQDAVAAANVLAGPLKTGRLQLRHLQAVQRQREWPTQLIQAVQGLAHRWIVARALTARKEPFALSGFLRLCLRLPLVRDLPTRLIAFDVWPVTVQRERRENGDPKCRHSSMFGLRSPAMLGIATYPPRRCRWPRRAHAAVVARLASSRR